MRTLVNGGQRSGQLSYRLVAVGPVFVEPPPPPPAAPAAAPPLPTTSRKRRPDGQPASQPYIRKPRNAFMLFLKEQRHKVSAEKGIRNSAAVNAAVGQKWNALSKEEQARYYEEAEAERRFHAQLYPGWSTADNYGQKRKRVRRRAAAASRG
ncbi:transcription factor 7-like 1 [Parambassis ranga]|uniref:Transcription factor 7-like 1 n=1 Tax=Parambassis ranga TaxID=210632 RepID=A0A6P7JHK9_9TELE|nr:transcription factor 7-like 1 [Parambassis ranga]